MGQEAPHISLVIPAFNEEKLLPGLLDTVAAARAAYPRGRGAVEVIVADNGSTDATAKIAEERGCRVVKVEPHVIAAVRNGGAAAARGELLAFIDADSLIDVGTFAAIEKALARPEAVAGTTGVRPDRWSLGIAITFAIFSPVIVLLKIDTGVVCCRRKDFEAVGGYDETMKFAEDIRLLWDLRTLGKKRGQKLVRIGERRRSPPPANSPPGASGIS